MTLGIGEINRRFNYHRPPDDVTARLHSGVREHCRALAIALDDGLPDGREKSLAFTHLEEVMFWANGAIARNAAKESADV